MKTLYDVVRYLIEHGRHPVDETKQEALKIVDQLEADAGLAPKDGAAQPADPADAPAEKN